MYAWMWRKLPYGLRGRLIGSALLLVVAGVVLWLWVFPVVDGLLPTNDVQVTNGQNP